MYPQGELTRLAAAKAALRAQIAARRLRNAEAVAQLVRPLDKLDHARRSWHELSPQAKAALVSLAFLGAYKFLPVRKVLKFSLRWSAMIFRIIRLLR